MNASQKQVEAYQKFILAKRTFFICKLQQVILEFVETVAHLKKLLLL